MTTISIGAGQTISGQRTGYGDNLYVNSGGTAVATTLDIGLYGAHSDSTTGGYVTVSGGTASRTVQQGGVETVLAGGTVVSAFVAYGLSTVSSGGSDVGLTLGNGAAAVISAFYALTGAGNLAPRESVGAGGTAVRTVVDGSQSVMGGTASGAVVNGSQDVGSGGLIVGDTLNATGTLTVSSGGTASGIVLTGGTLTIMSGGTATGILLQQGDLRELSSAQAPQIDLAGLPYVPGGTAVLTPATDVLTVTQGSRSTTLQLAGDYTGRIFQLSPDAKSGTVVSLAGTRGTSGAVTQADGSIIVAGSGSVATAAGSSNRIVLGTGVGTVSGAGQDTVFGGTGPSVVTADGSDTVVGGTGALTFFGGAGNSVVFGGSGTLTYTGGSGTDIVVGRGGPMVVAGGTGGGTYFGGGSSTIVAGKGAQAVLVGSDGDSLFSSGAAGDLFGVLGGSVLMSGAGSTGNDVFFGAAGTGTETILAGSGDDILGLGQGINRVTLGAGHDVVFANTGSTGVSSIVAGRGSADIGLGGQSVDVVISATTTAQVLTLFGFRVGVDLLTLASFYDAGPGALAAALAGQSNANGSTVLNIAGKTTVSLVGLAHADATVFGPSFYGETP